MSPEIAEPQIGLTENESEIAAIREYIEEWKTTSDQIQAQNAGEIVVEYLMHDQKLLEIIKIFTTECFRVEETTVYNADASELESLEQIFANLLNNIYYYDKNSLQLSSDAHDIHESKKWAVGFMRHHTLLVKLRLVQRVLKAQRATREIKQDDDPFGLV